MRRSRSRSNSPPIPQFPLILSFPAAICTEFTSEVKLEIVKKCDIDRLHISDEIPIGEEVFRFVYIYSHSLRGKIETLKLILEAVFPDRNAGEVVFSFQNLIDPGIVTKMFARNHSVSLQILPEIKGFPERQVKISGRLIEIEKSIKDIHGYLLDKRPSPEPKATVLNKTSAKFVIPEECVGSFIGRNGLFTKRLKADYEVDVKIVKSEGPPCKDTDHIILVTGKHRYVKRSIKIIVEKIIESLESSYIPGENIIKMLIFSSLVKELIGPQGAIIKDISKKAGNAKIKVLSDSKIEQCQEFTVVNIDGTLESKAEAASKVYEVLDKGDKVSPRPTTPEDDELRIYVSVPDQYVARLIGKNGENVKAIMSKAKCKISFQKAPVSEMRSLEGEKTRLCFVSGNSSCISKGVKLLLEQILKLELI